MNYFIKPFLLAVPLALSTPVFADWGDQNDKQGLYVGANYGGFKSRGGDFDDSNDYFQLAAGYRFTPLVGVELDYANFGEYGGDIASAELDGWGVSVIGFLPVTQTLDLYAKAGLFMSNVDVGVAGFSRDFSDEQVFFGLGAEFNVTNNFSLIAEYNRYKVEVDDSDFPIDIDSSDTDIDTLKVGVKLYF